MGRQLQQDSQSIYDSMLQNTLEELAREIAGEQLQFALYDKKAQSIVENCLYQAVNELAQEKKQAELEVQKIAQQAELDAKKAAQDEKIALDKEKAKIKKERQKQSKQAAAKADDDEDALLNAAIAQNAAIQKNVEATAQITSVSDAALIRRDVMRDLIKNGFKGERLSIGMIDHDLHNLHVVKDGRIQDELAIPKFLDLFEDLLKLPLSGTELLLHETLDKMMFLCDALCRQGKELHAYTDKKNELARLINLKFGQVELACLLFSRANLLKEVTDFARKDKILDTTLQLLKAQLADMTIKRDVNEVIALNLKIGQVQSQVMKLKGFMEENNRKCKMMFVMESLQRLQAPAGPFPSLDQPLPVAMQIGKLCDADLQNYRKELEQQCFSCIARNGKLVVEDIQPLVLNVLIKTALTRGDSQELSMTMTSTALKHKDTKKELTAGFKQGLFNSICTQNKLLNKPYDIHVAVDLTDVQFILIDVLQKIS